MKIWGTEKRSRVALSLGISNRNSNQRRGVSLIISRIEKVVVDNASLFCLSNAFYVLDSTQMSEYRRRLLDGRTNLNNLLISWVLKTLLPHIL